MPERAGEVAVLRGAGGGHLDRPPRICCARCGGTVFEQESVSGIGRLVSWTVVRHPPENFAAQGPVTIALIDLDAGPRLTGRLESGGDVEAGLRVRLCSGAGPALRFAPEVA